MNCIAKQPVLMVVATRAPTMEAFFSNTMTGRSLRLREHAGLTVKVFLDNKRGLSACYNEAIRQAQAESSIIVFAHDDLLLLDFHWPDSVRCGLEKFDVIGVAGNRRRVPRQPAWFLVDDRFTWDTLENLSGVVAHGNEFPPADMSVYGPPGQPVVLLDGLFIAVKNWTLAAHALEFDESFDFHFYDLDFCREAELRALRLGTWPISVVHRSGGQFMTDLWKAAYAKYLEKWGE